MLCCWLLKPWSQALWDRFLSVLKRYQWNFEKCVGHTKFTPFSTPLVLYNKHLPYPKSPQTAIWRKRKQEKRGTHHLFYWRCSTVWKSTSRNKEGGGKKAENALSLNGLAFTCWKNTIFLFAAIEANSVYFVLKDCWTTFQKYYYFQDRKFDFWMLLLLNNLYSNYIFVSSSKTFFIPGRLR